MSDVAKTHVATEGSAATVQEPDESTHPLFGKYRYCCKKCRATLYTSDEIVPHEAGRGARGHKKFKHQGFHDDTDGAACTSHFLDPDVSPWVSEDSRRAHEDAESAVAAAVDDLERRKNEALQKGDFDTYLRLEGLQAGAEAPAVEGGEEDNDDNEDDDDDEIIDDDDEDDEDEEIESDDDDKTKRNPAGKAPPPSSTGKSESRAKAPGAKAAARGAKATGFTMRRGKADTSGATAGAGPSVVAPVGPAVVVDPDTIYCPNARCRAKIGAQSWIGSQCSCGAWVTPSFKVHISKVDEIALWRE